MTAGLCAAVAMTAAFGATRLVHGIVARRTSRARRPQPRPRWWRAPLGALVASMLAAVILGPALVPICVAAFVGVPLVRRRLEDARRARAAATELPLVLEGVARGLRSGSSLAQAIVEVAAPHSPALRAAWTRLTVSVPVLGVARAAAAWPDAASDIGRRREDRAARSLVASSLVLAADVGGPQARALDLASTTLRQRLSLDAELRAQSAQARASATVIALAPVAFAVLAGATDARYVPLLLRTLPGACLLYAGLALDAAGLWWMARLVATAE